MKDMEFYILLLSLAGLLIIWSSSSLGKKWIKFWIYIAYCFSISILIPVWLFRPKDSRNALLPSAGFRALCKILGLKYSIEGKEHIVKNSGSVVLLNHQSILDLIVLSCLWPILPNCSVISKKELLYIQPIGLAIWLCGAIFINRTKPSEAHITVNKTGEIIRKTKARVLLFPEGTRNGGSKLAPFKKGAFHLAIASQCPIQPVAVSRFTFLGPNKFDEGEIKIRILPPISTKNCTAEDIPRLMEKIYETMSGNVDELSVTGEL